MRVKICGITDLYTAEKAIACGADALGFVFAKSKRQVQVDQVEKITLHLHEEVIKVGVFVNESPESIANIARTCKLDFIQLHGDEAYADYRGLAVPIIKAFGIQSRDDLQTAVNDPSEYILLDSPKGKYHGGNGQIFNWELLRHHQLLKKQVILAGGLTEDNVEKAIEIVSPYMVDVSSGVETNGKKDILKIKRFIKIAKIGGGNRDDFRNNAE